MKFASLLKSGRGDHKILAKWSWSV